MLSFEPLEVLSVYVRGRTLSVRIPPKLKEEIVSLPFISMNPAGTILLDRRAFAVYSRAKRKGVARSHIEPGDFLKLRFEKPVDANEVACRILEMALIDDELRNIIALGESLTPEDVTSQCLESLPLQSKTRLFFRLLTHTVVGRRRKSWTNLMMKSAPP